MKKTIILILIIILAIVAAIPAAAFVQNTATDIDRHWAEEEINTLKALAVMNGYMGRINPDGKITRGEFTALITRMFDMNSYSGDAIFSDVGREHIFFNEINTAYKNGIINGFSDNSFKPEKLISREEIMLIISRLDNVGNTGNINFTDISDNYKYRYELSKVTDDNIIGGYPDGSFKPENMTSRAEAAKIINAAAKTYMPKEDTSILTDLATEYIKYHFADLNAARQNSIGIANSDTNYIEKTYNIANNSGHTLKNEVYDIKLMSANQEGPFGKLIFQYNVKRIIDSDIKIYKGQSHIYTITKNNITKIYRHDTEILKENFINLTWEVFASAPSYAPPGVNVVSPTSFRISQTKEKPLKTIDSQNGILYFNSSLKDEYIDYARLNNYDIWVMYKTDFKTDTASKFLNSDSARYEAAAVLAEQILKYRLDGVNFDFENMYKADRGAYTNHVKEISLMAHTLGAAVSVDITKYEPTSSTWSMCYDRDGLSIYADFLCLMAYDQYYAASKTPGPVAGLSWTENCIDITLKEVPTRKLILAMPYYIRIWEHKDGKSVSSKAVSMMEANRQITQNNAVSEYDSKHSLTKYSWTTAEGKSYVLWLENAESTAKRVALAKKYQLAGVASWRRGFETSDVWDAIKNEIEK